MPNFYHRHLPPTNLLLFPELFSSVLDDISGARGGWSIKRRLTKTFSLSLIRIRRSSDNAELDISFLAGTNLLNILAMETFCSATDGFVTKIYDQSGNNDDFIQATSTKQPKIVSSGTTLVDSAGNPIARFDGIDDSMQVVSIALDAYSSIYFVATLTLAKPMFIEHSVDANNNDGFFFFGSDSHAWVVRRTTVHRAGVEVNWMGSSLAQVTFIYGGTGTYYLNGVVQTNSGEIGSDVGDSSTTDALNLFSRNQVGVFSDGDFNEFLIFDGAHNSADQSTAETSQKNIHTTP